MFQWYMVLLTYPGLSGHLRSGCGNETLGYPREFRHARWWMDGAHRHTFCMEDMNTYVCFRGRSLPAIFCFYLFQQISDGFSKLCLFRATTSTLWLECCGWTLHAMEISGNDIIVRSSVSRTRAVSQLTVASTDNSIQFSVSPILERHQESNVIQALK